MAAWWLAQTKLSKKLAASVGAFTIPSWAGKSWRSIFETIESTLWGAASDARGSRSGVAGVGLLLLTAVL